MTMLRSSQEWEQAADRRLRGELRNLDILADRTQRSLFLKHDGPDVWNDLYSDRLFRATLEFKCVAAKYLGSE